MVQDPVLQEFLELPRFGSTSPLDRVWVYRTDSDYDLLIVVPRKDDQLLDGLYEGVMDNDLPENFSRRWSLLHTPAAFRGRRPFHRRIRRRRPLLEP